jgi:amino acid adenylation domain-containing protein
MQLATIKDLISDTAERFSDHIALEWRDRKISYREFEQATNSFANCLIANGIRKGARVAILVHDRIKLIEAIVGTLKAGCAFAPLDASEPDKRLARMVADVEPELFVVEQLFYEKFSTLASGFDMRSKVIIINRDQAAIHSSDNIQEIDPSTDGGNFQRPAVEVAADDLCYIFFTSGSTGAPKPIAGRLKSLLHFAQWEIKTFAIDQAWRASQFAVPTFDACLRDIFVPLLAGATICIPDGRETLLDTPKLVRWIEESRVNLIHCVPSVFRSLLREPLAADQFPSLRYIIMAGEHISPVDVKKWTDAFGERIQLVNLYGATENTMAKFCYFIKPSDQSRRVVPIGKPIDGAKAIILSDEGKICDPGVAGEIYIRTPFLTLGYYNRPDLTSQVFVKNPFSADPNDIIYKTGDLGRLLPDGNFELLGRKDHQVKIRGQRVELGEIEAILKQHPTVEEAVAAVKGEDADDKRLVAYFISDSDESIIVSELRQLFYDSLPEYMAPSAFVKLSEMPMTRTGKIDRNALPEPDQSRPQLQQAYTAPRNQIEQIVAGIWSQVLKLEQIGVHDNFFQLGGHSLMATQVMSRMREAFEIEVPLRNLFETPTIAGLALAVEQLQSEQTQSDEAQVMALIESMSEEDAEAMLAQLSASSLSANG